MKQHKEVPSLPLLALLACLVLLQRSHGFTSLHAPSFRHLRSKLMVASTIKHNSSPSSSSFVFPVTSDDKNNDDEDDEEEGCNAPKYGLIPEDTKQVFLISDNTGTLVKAALQASLAQFESCDDRYQWEEGDFIEDDLIVVDEDGNPLDEYNDDNISVQNKSGERCDVKTRVFTFIRSEEALASVIKTAKEKEAMVVFTLVDLELREKCLRMCELSNVRGVDLLGPTLTTMSTFLGKSPAGLPQSKMMERKQPAKRVALSDSYYRRIEAVEFTLKADDGQSPWLLEEAEVIIVGVSRTGKTPLSVILSQTQGLKVANIPLVLECPPPKELFDLEKVDPKRVFCLSIAPTTLKQIRTTRLERRNVHEIEDKHSLVDEHSRAKSNYADRAYIMKDLKNVRDLALENSWTQIDVTGRAVEETASYICELLKERFETHDLYV